MALLGSTRIRRAWAALVSPYRDALLGALVTLGLLAPLWLLGDHWYRARLLADQQVRVANELAPLGSALTAALHQRLALLDGLSAFLQTELATAHRLPPGSFDTLSAQLIGHTTGIRTIVVAPGGVDRYVYPLRGNENVPGHDLLHDARPAVRADVLRAIQTRGIGLSGPYELRQGGLGLVARQAIFRGDRFWGLAILVLDVPPLLREAGLAPPPANLAVALRDGAGHTFDGPPGVFGARPVLHRIGLPEGAWLLAATPTAGWAAAIRQPLRDFRIGSLAVMVFLVALAAWTLYRTARLRETLGSRTRELERDIAERQQMEEALWLSRTHFSSIVELSEDAIISVDGSQHLRLFNRGAEKIFGYRAEEVLGKSLDLLLPARFAQAHRGHVQGFAASADVQRPMNQRQTIHGRRKGGREFPAEASISKFEVRGERIMTVRLRDITERQQAEEALSRLAAIVASSDDAILAKTLDGIILTWNAGAERLYGYTAEEVQGRSVSLIFPEDRLDELPDILARLRRGESIQHYETQRVRRDGRLIDVSLSLSPIRDASGAIIAASAIARDITEQKRLEAQILQAQKMEAIGTLAGGIAHDFNNILSAMLGYTELASDDVPRDGEAWQNLQGVLAAGRRARDLVQHILTFSRQGEQERRPTPLHEVAREAMKLLRASLPATIEIRQHVDPHSGAVLADATQMHQVLMNLCANAEHAMRPQGGLLEVRLEAVDVGADFAANHPPLAPGPHVRLTVRDTGHGMTAEVRERIFEPFFTTKERGEGTGMGLAVVHGIVAAHGGAITVESALDRGARFDIYLPRCDLAAPVPVRQDEPVRGGRERILFVDDEPFLAHVWREMLERMGYRATAFPGGTEALEAFRADPEAFDLLITDQTMPRMTGEELAREVLRLRPNLPVILCTGFSHTMTEEKARALGIRAYLMKPIDRRELGLTVQRLLGQRVPQGT